MFSLAKHRVQTDDNADVMQPLFELWVAMRSPETRRSYRAIAQEFLGHVGSWECSKGAVARYLMKMQEKHPNKRTAFRKYLVLRKLYHFFVEEGAMAKSPFPSEMHAPPKTPNHPTEALPMNKVQELLNLPNPKTIEGKRDRAMLALLFGCALRRREVLGIELTDVVDTGESFHIKIKQKGGERRIITLPDWAAERVREYYNIRVGEKGGVYIGGKSAETHPPGNLFLSYVGNPPTGKGPLSESTLYRLFKGYCWRVGLAHNRYSPHSARATAITKALSDGMNYREVQEISGHKSVRSVEVYDKRRYDGKKAPGKKLKY